MTLLLRKIDTSDGWLQWGEIKPEDLHTTAVPLAAAREFVPRPIDKNWISVFELEEKAQAIQIAAAFAWEREKLDSGTIDFAVAYTSRVLEHSFEIREKPGTTKHRFADRQHREILVKDLASLEKLARIFLEGDIISYQGKALGEAARSSAKVDQFEYAGLSQKPFSGNWQAKNLLRFISDDVVKVIGYNKSFMPDKTNAHDNQK